MEEMILREKRSLEMLLEEKLDNVNARIRDESIRCDTRLEEESVRFETRLEEENVRFEEGLRKQKLILEEEVGGVKGRSGVGGICSGFFWNVGSRLMKNK